MNSKVYKWCAVPLCKSTSIATPNKLFIYVPNKKTVRDEWLQLARRDPAEVVTHSAIYFCEDHFDLPNDMENYMQYHLMGSVAQVRTVPGCVPTKFECQQDREGQTSDTAERPYYLRNKRKRMTLDKSEKQSEESTVTEHVDSEETVSGNSGSPPGEDGGGGGSGRCEKGRESGTGSGRKRARRSRQYCMARGCPHTNTRSPHLSFFSLPRDRHRRQQWLTAVNREDLLNKEAIKCKSYVVCSSHFDDSQIRIVKHIKADAVPRGVGAWAGESGRAVSAQRGGGDGGLAEWQRRRLERLQRTQVLHLHTGGSGGAFFAVTTHTHTPAPAHTPSPHLTTQTINVTDVKIEKVEPDWNWDEQHSNN